MAKSRAGNQNILIFVAVKAVTFLPHPAPPLIRSWRGKGLVAPKSRSLLLPVQIEVLEKLAKVDGSVKQGEQPTVVGHFFVTKLSPTAMRASMPALRSARGGPSHGP